MNRQACHFFIVGDISGCIGRVASLPAVSCERAGPPVTLRACRPTVFCLVGGISLREALLGLDALGLHRLLQQLGRAGLD